MSKNNKEKFLYKTFMDTSVLYHWDIGDHHSSLASKYTY